jgi:hypothetical protein
VVWASAVKGKAWQIISGTNCNPNDLRRYATSALGGRGEVVSFIVATRLLRLQSIVAYKVLTKFRAAHLNQRLASGALRVALGASFFPKTGGGAVPGLACGAMVGFSGSTKTGWSCRSRALESLGAPQALNNWAIGSAGALLDVGEIGMNTGFASTLSVSGTSAGWTTSLIEE